MRGVHEGFRKVARKFHQKMSSEDRDTELRVKSQAIGPAVQKLWMKGILGHCAAVAWRKARKWAQWMLIATFVRMATKSCWGESTFCAKHSTEWEKIRFQRFSESCMIFSSTSYSDSLFWKTDGSLLWRSVFSIESRAACLRRSYFCSFSLSLSSHSGARYKCKGALRRSIFRVLQAERIQSVALLRVKHQREPDSALLDWIICLRGSLPSENWWIFHSRVLLCGNMEESLQDKALLEEVSMPRFKKTDALGGPQWSQRRHDFGLLANSESIRIWKLLRPISQHLQERLSIENVCRSFNRTLHLELEPLENACYSLLERDLGKISDGEILRNLSAAALCPLLSRIWRR